MRVISGQWRGRRLKVPTGLDLRPTTDRVKEALFNILAAEIADAHLIDLCCGAGGLGLEALSRGAAHCLFVDSQARALQAVQANLETCRAAPDRYTLLQMDALAFLDRLPSYLPAGPWILVADPPYAHDLVQAILDRGPELVRTAGCLAVVLEHEVRQEGGGAFGVAARVRRYGRTALTILRPEGEQAHG